MGSRELASGPFAFIPAGGGPVDRLEHRLGLRRDDARDPARQALAFIALTWVPLLVLGAAQRWTSGAWDPLLSRFEVHVRPLVAAPLLFAASAIIAQRARLGIEYLAEHRILPEARWEDLRRLRARVERLRDSVIAEGAVAALALSTSVVAGATAEALPLRLWHELVSLPLMRYVTLRMLWRWLLWCYFLFRLSRLDLRLLASHPDRVGGLAPLSGPSASFGLVVMAMSAAAAAGWATLVRGTELRAADLQDEATAMIALSTLLALLPLLSFAGPLRRLARQGTLTFGGLAARYCGDFERKWAGARREDLLGTPDLQSLADLGGSYEVVAGLRPLPITGRLVVRLVAAGMLPLVPLLLTEVPLTVLLQRIAKAALT